MIFPLLFLSCEISGIHFFNLAHQNIISFHSFKTLFKIKSHNALITSNVRIIEIFYQYNTTVLAC